MKELLDAWQDRYSNIFRVVYCVGSRYNNIHMGVRSKCKEEYIPPPLPAGFSDLKHAELVSMIG